VHQKGVWKALPYPLDRHNMLKRICINAFIKCRIEEIRIPKTVEVLEIHCFSLCEQLRVVEFEEGSVLKEIGEMAFSRTAISKIRIPKSVETIKMQCFAECSQLREIEIERESVLKTISKRAFPGGVERLVIPKSIQSVDIGWFHDMKNDWVKVEFIDGETFLLRPSS
jgi:hypothetical protein